MKPEPYLVSILTDTIVTPTFTLFNLTEATMEVGDLDSIITNNDDSHAYSDNISFNSNSISVYSAEEQIIQQRGRRSSIDFQIQQIQHLQQIQQIQQQQQHQAQQHTQLSVPPFEDNKRKPKRNHHSLLRTPVKRRLRLRRDRSSSCKIKL